MTSISSFNASSSNNSSLNDNMDTSSLSMSVMENQTLVNLNYLLKCVGMDENVSTFDDLLNNASSIFVALFESMFKVNLEEIVRDPKRESDYVHNAQVVIDYLSNKILKIPFRNINGIAIAQEKHTRTIINLVEIFSLIWERLFAPPQRTKTIETTWYPPPKIIYYEDSENNNNNNNTNKYYDQSMSYEQNDSNEDNIQQRPDTRRGRQAHPQNLWNDQFLANNQINREERDYNNDDEYNDYDDDDDDDDMNEYNIGEDGYMDIRGGHISPKKYNSNEFSYNERNNQDNLWEDIENDYNIDEEVDPAQEFGWGLEKEREMERELELRKKNENKKLKKKKKKKKNIKKNNNILPPPPPPKGSTYLKKKREIHQKNKKNKKYKKERTSVMLKETAASKARIRKKHISNNKKKKLNDTDETPILYNYNNKRKRNHYDSNSNISSDVLNFNEGNDDIYIDPRRHIVPTPNAIISSSNNSQFSSDEYGHQLNILSDDSDPYYTKKSSSYDDDESDSFVPSHFSTSNNMEDDDDDNDDDDDEYDYINNSQNIEKPTNLTQEEMKITKELKRLTVEMNKYKNKTIELKSKNNKSMSIYEKENKKREKVKMKKFLDNVERNKQSYRLRAMNQQKDHIRKLFKILIDKHQSIKRERENNDREVLRHITNQAMNRIDEMKNVCNQRIKLLKDYQERQDKEHSIAAKAHLRFLDDMMRDMKDIYEEDLKHEQESIRAQHEGELTTQKEFQDALSSLIKSENWEGVFRDRFLSENPHISKFAKMMTKARKKATKQQLKLRRQKRNKLLEKAYGKRVTKYSFNNNKKRKSS